MANDRRRQHNERVGRNRASIAGTIATCVDRLCVHVQFEEAFSEGNIDDANSPEPRNDRLERENRDDIGLLQNGILCDHFDGGPGALLIQVFDFKAMAFDVVREILDCAKEYYLGVNEGTCEIMDNQQLREFLDSSKKLKLNYVKGIL